MGAAELVAALRGMDGVAVRAGEPMARHTALRTGGPAEVWAVVRDLDALRAVLAAARRARVPWRTCWPFCEWLVRDGGIGGLVVRPGRGFEGLRRTEDGRVLLGAAAPWAALAALGGWSGLERWPGTPGGLLASPERGRMRGHVAALRWLRGRRVERVEVGRDGVPEPPPSAVLVEVELAPPRPARAAPPPAPGTLFADGAEPAPRALVRAGVADCRFKDWRLHPAAPGLLVHLAPGPAGDALLLARAVRQRVERRRGTLLEVRLPVLGRTGRRP